MTTHLASKPKTKITAHQMEVLRIVIAGNVSADPGLVLADLDEVLERVTKDTSKQAMQFTIRSLVHNKMIEKKDRVRRRGRLRVTFEATELGRQIGANKPTPAVFIETGLEDVLTSS